jgi:hypothetical protein
MTTGDRLDSITKIRLPEFELEMIVVVHLTDVSTRSFDVVTHQFLDHSHYGWLYSQGEQYWCQPSLFSASSVWPSMDEQKG